MTAPGRPVPRSIRQASTTPDARALSAVTRIPSEFLFLTVDLDGCVLDANDTVLEFVGAQIDELRGTDWIASYVHPDDAADVGSYAARLEDDPGGRWRVYENRIVNADGDERSVRWFHSVQQHQGRESIVAFGFDLRDEQELQIRLDQLTAAALSNPAPVFRVERTGDVTFANDAAQQLFTGVAEQRRSDHSGDRDPASALQSLLSRIASATRRREMTVNLGDRTLLVDVVPVDGSDHVHAYGFDITHALETGEQLAGFVDSLQHAAFVYELGGGGAERIEFVNDRCNDVWELSCDDIGHDPSALWEQIVSDDLPAMRSSVLESAANLTRWHFTWRIRTPSGKLKWLDADGSPTRLADGGTRWYTVLQDVTEQKTPKLREGERLQRALFALLDTIHGPDDPARRHERRIAAMAAALAEGTSLTQDEREVLELAAALHDIGLASLPQDVVHKGDRRSAEEQRLFEEHPLIGADVLSEADLGDRLPEIVRQHHERIDGSGYPRGLAGDRILMEAQILALAEDTEELARELLDGRPLGVRAVIDEIARTAGTRHDPELVDILWRRTVEGAFDGLYDTLS